MTSRSVLLGWNIYTGETEATMTFAGFVAAPDLDGNLKVMTEALIAETERENR